jgi:hypothetical protein
MKARCASWNCQGCLRAARAVLRSQATSANTLGTVVLLAETTSDVLAPGFISSETLNATREFARVE